MSTTGRRPFKCDLLGALLAEKDVPPDLAGTWVATFTRPADLMHEEYTMADTSDLDPGDEAARTQWGWFIQSASYWGARGYAPDDVTNHYVATSGVEEVFFGWGESGLPHETAIKFATAGISVDDASNFIGREAEVAALIALTGGEQQ